MFETGFLSNEDCNYVTVDWGRFTESLNYPKAVASVRAVGTWTGNFIRFLASNGASLRKMHVVGFSLGAHVAGYAGAMVAGRVGRITGEMLICMVSSKPNNELCNTCFPK